MAAAPSVVSIPESYLVKTGSNCSGNEYSGYHWSPLKELHVVVIAFIGAFLNSLALFIFYHHKSKTIFRVNLMILTLSECFLNSFNIINYFLVFSLNVDLKANKSVDYFFIFPPIVTLSYTLRCTFACARNWSTVLIGFARFEAVVFPMKMKRMFNMKSLLICYGLIIVFSAFLDIVSRYYMYIVICSDDPSGMLSFSYPSLQPYDVNYPITLSLFFWQTDLPWFVTVVTTVSIILALKLRPAVPSTATDTRGKRQGRAIRTVLAISIVFSVCELLSSIAVIYTNFVFTNDDYRVYKMLLVAGNTMIFLDSIFNFVIFTLTIGYFKEALLIIVRYKNGDW